MRYEAPCPQPAPDSPFSPGRGRLAAPREAVFYGCLAGIEGRLPPHLYPRREEGNPPVGACSGQGT